MPYTPFHVGPGMLVKAAMPRHFSIIVFGLTQIALDLEVLRHMMRHEYPWHTFWHTFLGATLIATIMAVIGKSFSQWIKMAWNLIVAKSHETKLRAPVSTSWCASITGAFIGAYSHIVFDSLYHSDIKPLQPWSESNRLLGVIKPDFMELICVVLGIAGIVWLFARWSRKKRIVEATDLWSQQSGSNR